MKYSKLLLILIILLSSYSCAYEKYAEINIAHINAEQTRMKEQTKVVMHAYEIIMRIMFPTIDIKKEKIVDSYLVNHLWFDDQGRKQMLQIKDTSQGQAASSDKFMAYIMFKELVPALHEIYQIQRLNMEAPVTIGAVLLKAAEAIPMLGAIAGPIITAGLLADQGIKVAGNTINEGAALNAGKANNSYPSYTNTWENKEITEIKKSSKTIDSSYNTNTTTNP